MVKGEKVPSKGIPDGKQRNSGDADAYLYSGRISQNISSHSLSRCQKASATYLNKYISKTSAPIEL